MTKLKKNIGYQTIYQILSTCLPLITSPYLSRILGAEKLGVYSYTQSIVNYFVLFAMLGMANYGTKSIAEVSNDKKEYSKTFFSLLALQIITCSIALVVYIFYLFFCDKDNLLISSIQVISILACYLDINWLFFGLEKFKITVIRNCYIKIVTVILILTLVKTSDDLWIYVLIMVLSTFFSQFVLWLYVPRLITKVKFNYADIIKHIKPNIVLFIPLAAMSVYHVMDKTMLGIFSTFEESGYYYNADKVINIPVGILNGITTVIMPRITSLISSEKHDEALNLFEKSLLATMCIATALTFGIAAISDEFVPFFFGEGYQNCIILIKVLSPVLIFKGFSNVFRYLYFIPYGMNKEYIYSIIGGVLINLCANSLLIPRYGAMGAVIGTVIAEFVVCLLQYIFTVSKANLIKTLIECLLFLLNGGIMYGAVRLTISMVSCSLLFKILIGVLVGAIVYLGILFIVFIAQMFYRKNCKV